MVGIDGGSTIIGTEGSTNLGTDGSFIDGTIVGRVVLGLVGDFTGEFDLDRLNLPISPDISPSLPSLISVTVDGSLLPVFLSYPSPGRGRGAAIPLGDPIPLGIPLSRLLDATTTTGGLGSGRLLGELNPTPLSNDLTDDIVSDLSSGDSAIGVLGVEGPASGGGAVCVRIGEGRGRVDVGRMGGKGADLEGEGGAGRVNGGGGILKSREGGRGTPCPAAGSS